MRVMLAAAVCGAAAALFGGLGRAAPAPLYPLDLDVAIGKAYGSGLLGIQRSCTVWLNGRDEYALAVVALRGGRSDVGGFQFINTAGWFEMWRSRRPTAAVPTGQRATVTKLVHRVAGICAARWTP